MAECSLKSWNGFPLIVDWRSEATPSGDRVVHHQDMPATAILTGDCREELPLHAPYDLIIGEACRRTGRRYIAREIDPARAERARARLAQMPSDLRRPA
ncbi:MAG: hypothetical protein Q4G49_14730 [Paracoccus sp. (in: a-proteobacteria)]|nr:hypothetical protein [Paracoccus sp. (in: a-proteobacteria)]